MSETHDRVAHLFDIAVTIESPEKRSQFLQAVCGIDARLRDRVQRLLRAHFEAGGFLKCNGGLNRRGQEKPGDRIQNYVLMSLIGEGGFSSVYLAEQQSPVRRWVALKIVKPGMDTHEVIARFEFERQALAVMDHPNIAKVYDAGSTEKGRPYFAMEWVQGVQITDFCDEQRFSIPQRLELLVAVCHAIAHAHRKGIVHRDIKPSNILITQHDAQPFPKIIDFGIAKVTRALFAGKTPLTYGGLFVGTPAYMSPEQVYKTHLELDARADVFSLGALLYELMTGHPPIDNDVLTSAELDVMLNMIRTKDPCKPSARLRQLQLDEVNEIAVRRNSSATRLIRSLQGDLDWITLKALEKDRDRRYRSSDDFAKDIQRHLNHQTVSAVAPTFTYRFQKLVRRNRKVVLLAAIVAAIVLPGVAVAIWQAARANVSSQQAEHEHHSALVAQTQAHEAVVHNHVTLGLACSDHENHAQALLWFANAARMARSDPEERDVNVIRARAWARQVPFPVRALDVSRRLKFLRFSPAGPLLLILSSRDECFLWDWQTNSKIDWPRHLGPVSNVAWHPDGTMLAMALATGEVQIRSVPEGGLIHAVARTSPVTALTFSPDGAHLAFGSNEISLWSLKGRSMAVGTWRHPDAVRMIVFSEDSQRVATACADDRARVFSVTEADASQQPVFGPVHHRCSAAPFDACLQNSDYREDVFVESRFNSPVFLHGGRELMVRSGPYHLTSWEIGTGKPVREIKGMCCTSPLTASPQGTFLACGVQGEKVNVWNSQAYDLHGTIFSHRDCVFDLKFDRQGERLMTASADHTARLWSVSEMKSLCPPLHHFSDVMCVDIAPEGRAVATAQSDGLVRVWRLPEPQENHHRLLFGYGAKAMRMDPRGQYVVAAPERASDVEFGSTRVYAVSTGLLAGPEIGIQGAVLDAALSPDQQTLATVSHPPDDPNIGSLKFWNVSSGELVGALNRPLPRLTSLDWHPDGSRIAAVGQSGGVYVVGLGETSTLLCLRQHTGKESRLHPQVRFARDGRSLVCLAPDGTVEVWGEADRRLRYPAIDEPGSYCWSFAFSQDNKVLVTTAANGRVGVRDLPSGVALGPPLLHPAWVYKACFSPDGRLLITACHDGQARVWDWKLGRLACHPFKHANQVYDATFTPDGRWAITACRDGTVQVWDPRSGHAVSPPVGVDKQVFNVQVSGDGRHVVVGGLEERACVLPLDFLYNPKSWNLDALCLGSEIASGYALQEGKIRELTVAEWLDRFRRLEQLYPDYLVGSPSHPLLDRHP